MSLAQIWQILKPIGQTLRKIVQTICGPIFAYVLYYYDVLSDFINTITLFKNCQPLFASISLMIIFTSYLTTVIYLKYVMKETLISSLCYPLRHGRNIFNMVKQNCFAIYKNKELPKESEDEKKFSHHIVFMEAISESVLQVCMSCMIIRQFGISTNVFESFMQLSGLITSLVSICLAFSKVSYNT